jgi:glycosyltransferase involved in cell wall biosynthesis
LGSLDDGGLATVYARAKLLLMPSLYEGFGLPILEAFQFGVPVLTSAVSAMPEVAGQGGVLVDPQSSASISEGMRRLLTDEVLYAQCARGAAKQLLLFNWDVACAATAQVLQGD